jgi:HK97 family phage major capsid protein
MKETTFTNAADTVAEGGTKPESTLIFDAVSDQVRKIAHWLPVTEEMLEDVQQARSYIDGRLRVGVQLAEDDQLLQGSGVAPDVLGVLNRPGLTAATVRTDPETAADAIARAIAAVEAASMLPVDGIVMNPINWLSIVLAKTDGGDYIGGSPFETPLVPRLWGRPVAITPAIIAGTALVGSFAGGGGQIFRHGGIRVEASNSHADFFVKNLTALRAEERLALAIYRASAFGTVTALT